MGRMSTAAQAQGQAAGRTGSAAPARPTARPPSWPRQALIVLGKDLLIELRSREVVVTSGFFAVLVVVIASMAFYVGPETRSQVAAGVIWLAAAFSAVLGLSRMWAREREQDALEGLLATPVSRSAVFAGKASGLLAFLLIIVSVVIPLVALFFSIDLARHGPGLALIAAAATPGVAAAGTLFGAMTARTRARDLVLAVILFPLIAPTLLAAVVATRELLDGASVTQLRDYLQLMLVFDLTFIAGGLGLFGTLIES